MSDNEMDVDHSNESIVTHDLNYNIVNSHFDDPRVPPETPQVDLTNALNVVAGKLPQVSWKTVAEAMAACVKCMPRGAKNEEVIKFVQDCMFQVLHVMISLNAIEGNPRSLTGLQNLWKPDTFQEFNRCFHVGLSDAVRTMVRIGDVSSATELKNWHDWEYNKQRHSTWINSLEVLMDCEQAAYRSEDHLRNLDPLPNTLWTTCLGAFIEEGGFRVLYTLIDSDIFKELPGDKTVEREQVLHCKIARLIKRMVTRNHVNPDQPNMPNMPTHEEVALAIEAVNLVTAGALEWLKARLNSSPDKLTQQGKSKDTELIDCLTELIGPDQSLGLARGLLSMTSLGSQQAGLRLARELRKQGGEMGAALGSLPHEFLETLQSRLNGSGDEIVKQLMTMKVVAKRAIVDTFEELAMLMETDGDKFKVCMFWGDVGLRCMCTSDDRTREIGIGLLDSLTVSQPHFPAHDLAPVARKALKWLTDVCGHSEEAVAPGSTFNLSKSLEVHGLKECERLSNFFLTIHHVLIVTGCTEEAETIAGIWMDTAVLCLRALDKYPVREMGLLLVQQAITLNNNNNYAINEKYGGVAVQRAKLGRALNAIITTQESLQAVLDSLFTEKYAHHAVIRLASTWLVDVYYREYCYEDELVNLMAYLVDATVHPDWGVVEPVTDLLVKVTVTNISIKSLNSLCNIFKEAVNNKTTAAAANTLILTWIDKTRQKKWVIGVQERVLNLLWTMLVNNSSESEDDTSKVLDYFKNQFSNIRGHASSDWGAVERALSEKEITARHCILTCATDCLAEIKRCGDRPDSQPTSPSSPGAAKLAAAMKEEPQGFPPLVRTQSTYEPEELRSRASQSAPLLNIVLSLVDNLRPDVLREMHGDSSPNAMVEGLLDEALSSASYEDVDSAAVLVRLQLIANISSYLIESSPLTFKMVKSIWDHFFGPNSTAKKLDRHRQVCLRWFHTILRPKELASDLIYFKPIDPKQKKSVDEAVESRRFVLEQLGNLVMGSGGQTKMELQSMGSDGVDCLLSLFLWVNRDSGVLEEADKVVAATASVYTYASATAVASRYNKISPLSSAYLANAALPLFADVDDDEIDDVKVCGEEILSFDALTTAALDIDPSEKGVVYPACRTLLKVSTACFKTRRNPPVEKPVSESWSILGSSKSKDKNKGAVNTFAGLERYDLLDAIFGRIVRLQESVASRSSTAYSPAEVAQLNHWLAVLHHFFEETSVYNFSPSHGGSSQGEDLVLSVALEIETEAANTGRGGGGTTITESDPRSLELHDNATLSEVLKAAKALLLEEKDALEGNYVLRRMNVTMVGDNRTLKNIGVVSGEKLTLGLDVPDLLNESPMLPSPAEQFSASKRYVDIIFGLLSSDELCEHAWGLLQMVPSATSEEAAIREPSQANWSNIVGSAEKTRGLWSRLYACQLVEAKLLPASKSQFSGVAAWRRGFLGAGGLKAVLSMLDGEDLATMSSPLRKAVLAPLLRVVNLCVCSSLSEQPPVATSSDPDEPPPTPSTLDVNDDSSDVLRRFSIESCELVKNSVDLKQVMDLLFGVIRVGNSASDLSESEVDAVSNSMATVTAMMRRSDHESWSKVSSSFPLNVLLRLLVESPVKRLRNEAAGTFQELLAGGEKVYTLYGEVGGVKSTQALPAADVLGPLFFGERLSNLTYECCTASEFFSVCHVLLDVPGSWLQPHSVRLLLETKLKSFASCSPRVHEKDGSDSVLIGVLATLSRLQLLDPPSPQEARGLIDLLLDTFLMRLPENARPSAQSKVIRDGREARAWESGPICGTIKSRDTACEVLVACSVNDELKLRVLTYLADFARATRPPPAEVSFMSSRAADEIKDLERPGLNNTANRCYMNSLCQQLTALSTFSSALLATPIPASVLDADAAAAKAKEEAGDSDVVAEPTEGTWDCPMCTCQNDVSAQECCVCESPKPPNVKIVAAGVDPEVERKEVEAKAKEHKFILREFQRTVRFLKDGEMKCFDAEVLLETVGKHLSLQFPAEQQNDTKEFMDKLLDRLEIELGDNVAKDLVKDHFGATTAETKVRQHDGKLVNRNTTTMTTYTLQLQVEGVSSLEEAIETNLAPNIREVDDDDEVDDNGKPVKHKFEYRTLFVNLPEVLCVQLSRFSFDYGRGVPIKHNHRVEFPMELNMGKYTESGQEIGPDSVDSTLYRLRGCLVHLGPSANQGHYYSIIRSNVDPDIFLKYNDNHVSAADSIEDECFGGERVQTTSSGKYSHEKNWNAYLLFYERVHDDVAVNDFANMSLEDNGSKIREIQETEVTEANADLWRRKLLYQRPVLNLSRKLIVQALPGEPSPQMDDFSQAGLTLFGHGVLHCGELSSDQVELKAWVNALGPVMNPASAASFLAAVAAGEAKNADDPEASKQLSLAVEASLAKLPANIPAWTCIPLLSRSILQVGSRVSSPGMREATAKLIAHAADKTTDYVSLEALLSRMLVALQQLYSEKELLEGFVTLIHALAKFRSMHEFLHRLDIPALLVHVYLNQSSPLTTWSDSEAICAAGGVSIPKLGSNTRRGMNSAYSQILHDFKRLLRALACLLQYEDTELTPLGERALADSTLINRLVERDPIAGVEPALPKALTLEEQNAALAEEGWRHHGGANGSKGYWVREGYKNSYTSERPTPRAQSLVELEDEGLLTAQPRDLLLVALALRSPDMQSLVLEALLEGVANGVINNWVTERRCDALSMLLKCDDDGLRASRVEAAHVSLCVRIEDLRDGKTPELQALKNMAQCTRMELLTLTLRRVREEGADVLGDISPDDGLLWVDDWLEQRKPQLRVTLKDLQGCWTNNQLQRIRVEKDQCTFANSAPVTITQEPDTGTFSVPGWSLVQEDSFPGNVLWGSKLSRDTTRWTRVQSVVVDDDDDDDELYNDNNSVLQNSHTL